MMYTYRRMLDEDDCASENNEPIKMCYNIVVMINGSELFGTDYVRTQFDPGPSFVSITPKQRSYICTLTIRFRCEDMAESKFYDNDQLDRVATHSPHSLST